MLIDPDDPSEGFHRAEAGDPDTEGLVKPYGKARDPRQTETESEEKDQTEEESLPLPNGRIILNP